MMEELGFALELSESTFCGLYYIHCVMPLLDILFLFLLCPPPHSSITLGKRRYICHKPGQMSAAKGLGFREMGRQPALPSSS